MTAATVTMSITHIGTLPPPKTKTQKSAYGEIRKIHY